MRTIQTRPADEAEAARIVRTLGVVDAMAELRLLLGRLEDEAPDADNPRWCYARRTAPQLARRLVIEGANVDAELARLRVVLEGERVVWGWTRLRGWRELGRVGVNDSELRRRASRCSATVVLPLGQRPGAREVRP